MIAVLIQLLGVSALLIVHAVLLLILYLIYRTFMGARP